MNRLCYIGVNSSNERSQKTKEKKAKIFVSNYFSNYPRKFYRQQCKKREEGPYLPVSRIWSGFSNGPEYPDSGSGSQEAEMAHTKRKNIDIECFEELDVLSDGLEAFLELGKSFMETYKEIGVVSLLHSSFLSKEAASAKRR